MSRAKTLRRPLLRWIERALLVVAILCLGGWAWAWLDARYTQQREARLLDEAIEARAAAPQPARETDNLESFRESSLLPEDSPELPEGALVARLEIPRLGVSAIVLEGIGSKTLRRAVGHIPETPFPGEAGNVGLAGHRDSFFRGLKDVRKNDMITLDTPDGTYRYQVEWTRIVLPEETQVLDDAGKPALTLVTCYPFFYVGSAPQRFIVRANQVGG
jgi:sortase A